MTDPDQDELVALRRRAYGRDADIHLDPASLARLDELENARTSVATRDAPELAASPAVEVPRIESSLDEAPHDEALRDEVPAEPWWAAAVRRVGPWVARVGRWLRGLRRSTVLIALAAALVVATLLTALTVVDRVQTDPLQAGAEQVARLGADAGYESPFGEFVDPSGPELDVRGYEVFYDLRPTTGLPFFSSSPDAGDSVCLAIYLESELEVAGSGFSGSLFGGCSAGAFPAMVQIEIDNPVLPAELAADYPDARGLQFVYDAKHDEVVVFVDG